MNLESHKRKELQILFELFKINSPSGKEQAVKKYVKNICKMFKINCKTDKKGNLYLKKGRGVRPCLAAHLDTVFTDKPIITPVVVNSTTIIGYDTKGNEQCGLGADDKVGVFIVLRAMLKYKNIKAVLTVEEETGCLGAKEINLDFFQDVAYVLQADRKGYGDFVTIASNSRYSDIVLCSKEFEDGCKPIISKYGFKQTDGGSTDVVMFKELGMDISVVNMSCGYYDAHEETEYINPEEVLNTLKMTFDVIDNLPLKRYTHKATLKKTTYSYNGYSSKASWGTSSWGKSSGNYKSSKASSAKRNTWTNYHSLQQISNTMNSKVSRPIPKSLPF
tara:strand:+ start:1273 stop:2271 length:999 start_codon:yes stop_codon:yes gene_type:complete